MSLKFYDNRNEDEHNELDKIFLRSTAGKYFRSSVIPPPAVMLWQSLVISICSSKSYESVASQFLDDNQRELEQLLNTAWEKQQFKAIRSLEFLNPAQPTVDQTTKNAWNAEYIGRDHETLLETLRTVNRSRAGQYSNILPIIQSSGMGKSRCVHETARFVFTLPLNTRPPHESDAYPPSDCDAYDFFLRPDAETFTEAYPVCCAFFKALFSSSIKLLESHLSSEFTTYEELALAWRELLQETRNEFYADVCLEAKRLLNEGEISRTSGVEIIMLACNEGSRLRDVIHTRIVGKPLTKDDLTIMLYLDEAQGLLSMALHDGTMYDAFAYVAAKFLGFGFVLVTLSTNSTLAEFPTTLPSYPLARRTLPHPFTEFGFDCYEGGRALFRPNEMSLKDVAEESFMVKFGRPLFWSRLENSEEVDRVPGNIVHFARTKLIGRSNILPPGVSLLERRHNGLLAAIGTRILFEFDTSREESRTREMQLVEGHMRIVYSIPVDRQYIRSGYPSEPILAEAAAHEMNSEERPIINILSSFIDNGLIYKGDRGGLVARLILTQAYDKAIQTSHPQPWKYSQGVTVAAFLTALISEKYIEDVLNCTSDDGKTPLKEAFKNAYIRFTHFVQNGKDNKIDTDVALAGIVRGMALQITRNESIVDIMIPIALREDRLREEIMTGILIQVKDKAATEAVDINADELHFFPPDCEGPRPYITIVMQLGLQTASDIRHSHELWSPSRVVTKQSHRTPQSMGNSLHPRYHINIRGCSGAVYGVVNNEDAYAKVVAPHNIIADHPKKSPRNLAALRRLKPVWQRNKQCSEWIGVSALQREQAGGGDEVLPVQAEGDGCPTTRMKS